MNDDLRMAVGRNLHLKNYISKINNETGEIPDFHHRLTRDYSRMKMLN